MSNRVLGNVARGMLFVVSAPAGTGKTTLVQMLMDEFDSVKESVSMTTRAPRAGEVDGIHYHFVSEEEFLRRIEEGEFVENVELYGDRYGTSARLLEEQRCRGNHVVLTIDTQGALKLKDKAAEAVLIFVKPPSLAELRERLTNRKTEAPDVIDRRIAWAEKELEDARHYDYHVVNDDLDTAYAVLRSILIAEEHKQ